MKRFYIISGLLIVLSLNVVLAQSGNEGATRYGIASQSVINLRVAPLFWRGMATQVLMGTPLRVTEAKEAWLKVTTPEGYTAWTTAAGVKIVSATTLKLWNKSRKLIVTDYFTVIKKEASEAASVVSDAVWGDLVKNVGDAGNYYKIALPDGRMGYIKRNTAAPFDQWLASRRPTVENIIATAKSFIGFPYLWGGTSVKGMDCSGFTKTCFYLNGVILSRDASQQAKTGDEIDISAGYGKLLPGDFLFFGTKKEGKTIVSHVGIYLGQGMFIHSSGSVHISSLLPTAAGFDPVNAGRLLSARRIVPKIDRDPNIVSIKNHPFYQ